MFVHSVYFWLKPDLSSADQQQFLRGVESLTRISSVKHAFHGPPAGTDRPIIERGYSMGLVLVFEDEAAHDHYQQDPIHDHFRDTCAAFWDRVLIYDLQQ